MNDPKLKHRNELEQIFETLYSNIELLSLIYPQSRELERIFRKDMFSHNSKEAFLHTSYYLLKILNPDIIKQKITCWPILETKDAAKYRKECLNYVNELNTIYDYAEIPPCQASILISPIGYRYGLFMLKLSELVLHKHLLSIKSSVLYPPKLEENSIFSEIYVKHLKSIVNKIDDDTRLAIDNFQDRKATMEEKLRKGEADLAKLNEKVKVSQQQLKHAQEELNRKRSASLKPKTSLDERFADVNKQLEPVDEIVNLFQKCDMLVKQINRNDLVLKYNEGDLVNVAESLRARFVNDKKELNLIEYFRVLNGLLEKIALEFPNITATWIRETKMDVQDFIEKYQIILKKLDIEYDRLKN